MIDYMTVTQPKPPTLADQLEKAKTFFVGYKKQIEDMRQEVGTFKVDSDDAAIKLTDMASQAATLIKTLESTRKDYIKEPDRFVRSLNAFVKTYRDSLEDLVKMAKSKIANFQFEQELQRRKAEKKAQEQQAQLQAKIDAEAADAGVEAPQMPAMVLPKKQEPIRSSAGSASLQTVWDWELDDFSKIPSHYLMVDDKKVKAAIKAGIREIPGIVIKEVPRTVLRTV